MRTLSATLQTAYGAPVQKPAWLVEIGFSSTLRLSSFDTVTFDGYSWLPLGVDVGQVRVDPASVSGSIILQNADNVYSALVLDEGTTDRSVRIWGYDAGATATADFELLVDGVCGKAVIDNATVKITLRDAVQYVYSPRVRATAAVGFTYMLPAGALVNVNGVAYRIERR